MHHTSNQSAALLRTARTAKHLSARQLGALAGISGSTVTRIESGHINPRLETLECLLAAAGYTLNIEATASAKSGDKQ